MVRGWPLIKLEPPDVIKFIRLPYLYVLRINQNLEVQTNPVCWVAIMYAVHIPETQKLETYHVRVILFLNLPFQNLFRSFAKFYRPSPDIPTSLFITNILAAFGKQNLPLAVMAKVNNCYTNTINSLFHTSLFINSIKVYYM